MHAEKVNNNVGSVKGSCPGTVGGEGGGPRRT